MKLFNNCKLDNDLISSYSRHQITIGFLKALKSSLNFEDSFEIAKKAFRNYMIDYHSLVLEGTKCGSPERFNKFRAHYQKAAKNSNYVKIVKNTPNILKVEYYRCTFVEILKMHDLSEYSQSFCLSDFSFTEALMPNVKFSRTNEISKGDAVCNHTWELLE